MVKSPEIIIPYHLICGIICGSMQQITPLLQDINQLTRCDFLEKIDVYLLANGVSHQQIADSIADICPAIIKENIHIFTSYEAQILSIRKARNLLQKSIRQAMLIDKNAIAWLIDDDMRIPKIAEHYLKWLPIMKVRGVDAVIGCCDGGSPNPAAHGMRVQINDLWHNLNWLKTLDDNDILPDKSQENAEFRVKYSDYYYDLSRKHHEHLTKPYWIIPNHPHETVAEARHYLLDNLGKIFTGTPFLRPLINEIPKYPLDAMHPSCNRGGNCFILNDNTLTDTPNLTTQSDGVENRRSDMIWALINRYYYGFNIVAVNFPLYHHRFVGMRKTYHLQKNIAEIRGAALYASLCDFFASTSNASWHFTDAHCTSIMTAYQDYMTKRLHAYQQNYQAIDNLLQQLSASFASEYPQILPFIQQAQNWITEYKATCVLAPTRLSTIGIRTALSQVSVRSITSAIPTKNFGNSLPSKN